MEEAAPGVVTEAQCEGCRTDYVAPWCDVHGSPGEAYDTGYQVAWEEREKTTGRMATVTDESIDLAARFLFRKDAPVGEPAHAWDTATEERKQVYRRSATMIAALHNGWNK